MSSTTAPLPIWVALAVLVAGWLAFLADTLVRGGSSESSLLWDTWVYDGLSLGCVVVVMARALTVSSDRLAWSFLGAGLAANALGDIIYSTLAADGTDVPFPNVADAFYLMFYPCLYVALVLLLRGRLRRPSASAWLDGVVAAGGLAALVAAVAFTRIAADAQGSSAAIVIGLAYPLGDLGLLAIAVGALAMVGWRVDARWWLLSAALAVFGAVDTVFLFEVAAGSYRQGSWLDALWPAACLALALSSWLPSRGPSRPPLADRAGLVPSAVCALAALAVLYAVAGQRLPALAVGLAAITVLAAVARFAITFREVAALAESRRQALTDDLTGLPNRRCLLQTLGRAGSLAAGLGLLVVDIDRFKEVNDSLGHHIGDELLVQLAARLRGVTRAEDVVARLGGDEFAVLLTASGGHADAGSGVVTMVTAELAARRIADALVEPFVLDDVTLHVQVSIGIGLLPEHTTDPIRLLQRADVAMYTAKSSGTQVGAYRVQDDPHSRERLQMLEELRTSLRNGGLICHYQPKITLATGAVHSVEALVRWQHPTRGLIPPDEFLSLAERAGLMRELTTCVLDTALAQVQRWRNVGLNICVAVNLSATNLLDVDLPERVGGLLAAYDLPASFLQVEITETVMMTDSARCKDVLHRLHVLGVQASIDDYGTGYSSLAYLQQLTVDELKIDQAFVSQLTRDPRAAAIVRSTIDLAHSLGLRIVAEGVEDAETAAELKRHGCDVSQGFYHSRPLPAADLTSWLWRHEHARSTQLSTTSTR